MMEQIIMDCLSSEDKSSSSESLHNLAKEGGAIDIISSTS
jgi:hypothetical protein